MKQLAQSLADTFGGTVSYQTASGKRAVAQPIGTMKLNIEVTDTFGHEANYSWVKRHELEVPECLSNYSVVRRVKALIGWNGRRCTTTDHGDMIELRPMGACLVCFITFG